MVSLKSVLQFPPFRTSGFFWPEYSLRPLANFLDIRYIKAARGSLSNGESRFFYSDFIEVKNFDLGAGIRGRL